ILKTTDGGNNWQSTNSPYYLYSVSFCDLNNGVISGDAGIILRTTDAGQNGTTHSSGVDVNLEAVSFPTPDNCVAVGGYGTIIRSTNGGITWVKQNSNYSFALMGVHFSDGNNGTAVGADGTILRTNNAGVPVELISFSFICKDDNIILNWQTASEINNQGFEIERRTYNSEFRKIGYVPGNGTTTETNSYSFIDTKLSPGKYFYRLKQIDFDGSFTYSNIIIVEVDLTPDKYTLEQNYPNPFNPSTIIKYSVPAKSFVTLNIYNSIGEKVAELVNQEVDPGNYEIHFDGQGLSSGIYYYKFSSDNFTDTKKMLLLK